MAEKKIQLQDINGNDLYARTKADIVVTRDGGNLGAVEAGAQVNKIEKIKVNGVELSIVSKAVNVEIPAVAEYSITKLATAESGYSATYQLMKDGEAVGEKINVPKDMVVQSGAVKTVTAANSPVSGYKVGDKYIDLILANADNSHVYIKVTDLIDVYTAGTGITISDNTVSVDTSVIATKEYVSGEVSTINTELANKAVKADVDAALALKANQSDVNTALAGKADKATTLSGYGITDAYTKTQVNTELSKKANTSTTLSGYGITDAITFVELA